MICKEGAIDVLDSRDLDPINGIRLSTQQLNGSLPVSALNGHSTLQNRRKSQLITFSASSCDIKSSLSHHELVKPLNGTSARNSIVCTAIETIANTNTSTNESSNGVRLSYTGEQDILIVSNDVDGSASSGGSATGSGSGSGTGSGSCQDADIDDDVFRRRSLEVDEEGLFDEEELFETHIETSNNANDDSGGGSYEDSHALHSSIGGSNRNSLEKDDDDIEVDVISTDVSCYDQLLGSSCNTRNDDDEVATLVGNNDNYTRLSKNGSGGGSFKVKSLNGVISGIGNGTGGGGVGGGVVVDGGGNGEIVGSGGGVIYANPFMDDEGIAESGM